MNTDAMFSSKTGVHGTPWELFRKLNEEFKFVLDVCADKSNAKCDVFYTEKQNGLERAWAADARVLGGAVWCNPPYGRGIRTWVEKAFEESLRGATVVMLLPARTDTRWWHAWIWDADHHKPVRGVEVRLLPGRVKFLKPDGTPNDAAPFPSAVVIFKHP